MLAGVIMHHKRLMIDCVAGGRNRRVNAVVPEITEVVGSCERNLIPNNRVMELLNEDWQKELIAQPESGMGYQNLAIELRNGETRHGTAFNAEFLLYSGESPHLLEKISKPSERLRMLEERQLGLGEEILSLRVLRSETDVSTRVRESSASTRSSSGASDAPEEELQEEEKFKRFSAYANDRRVTAKGGLVPGTFPTTEEAQSMLKPEEMP